MLKNNNTTLIIGGSSTIGKAFINENLNSKEVFISTYFQNKIILKNKYSKNLIQFKIDLNRTIGISTAMVAGSELAPSKRHIFPK